jgi:hypothetical protein
MACMATAHNSTLRNAWYQHTIFQHCINAQFNGPWHDAAHNTPTIQHALVRLYNKAPKAHHYSTGLGTSTPLFHRAWYQHTTAHNFTELGTSTLQHTISQSLVPAHNSTVTGPGTSCTQFQAFNSTRFGTFQN